MGVKPYGYWTSRENCKAEIANYKTLKEFRKDHNKGYSTILKKGWEDLLEPLQRYGKPISYEYCLLVSLACNYPFEVVKLDSSVYYKVKRSKWESELWSHFTEQPNKRIIWTKEKCHEVAMLCKSRSELENRFSGAYDRARDHDWLDDICTHMEPLGNVNSRTVYSIEFADRSVYVGLTYSMRVRLHQHFEQPSSNRYVEEKKLSVEYVIREHGSSLSWEDAQTLEHILKLKYKRNRWKILNIAKTGKGSGALGAGIKKWTPEKMKEAAKSCKSAKEFRKKFPVAYARASYLGILSEIQSHFKMKKTLPKGYWNKKENCLVEAKKFRAPGEMKIKSPTAYRKIIANRWRAEAFSHMNYLKPWKR
ncbi:GIY-YIG nuclease family protein [Bdellovibrio bacteriovorus]|uniref:GIY-YIG nuclease family protein n=1 Tax=Bdellovibrio bacteriovorus TaxID=959 RepID=UPI0035A5BC27